MNRARIIFAATALSFGVLSAAFGQGAPAGAAPVSQNTIVNPVTSSNPTDSEMQRKLQEMIQSQEGARKQTPAEVEKSKEAALPDADAISKQLQLACYVDDIRIVSTGKEKTPSGIIDAKVYEVACANSMGYFMVSQKPLAPTAFSCFAAEGQRAAAAAKGQDFADVCQLPENKNLMASATKIITKSGTPCKVTKLQWYGQSAATKTEYTELACADGKGYLLATALPGSPMQMGVSGCADAAAHGMKCGMTIVAAAPAPPVNSADPVPTIDMFKAALVQHNIPCTVTNFHVIGRENARKRHVVEFQCVEQPKGLVAFIPLGTNPNKFQTIDCPTAAKAKIMCTLTH